MEIRIVKALSKSLSNEKEMQKAYGMMWKKIIRVLDAIRRVNNLEELKNRYTTFEELKGDRAKTFSIRLTGNWRMIIEPDWESEYAEFFLKNDGGINYSTVNFVVILDIEDYH